MCDGPACALEAVQADDVRANLGNEDSQSHTQYKKIQPHFISTFYLFYRYTRVLDLDLEASRSHVT